MWNLPEKYEKEMKFEGWTAKMYRGGFSRSGHPIIFLRNRNQNSKDEANQMRYLAYTLELATFAMDPKKGVEKWIIVIDFKGQTLAASPSFPTTKTTIDILLNQFPERLYRCYFVDPPMFFNWIWKAVQPFLTDTTRAKVKFVSGTPYTKGGALHQAFSELVDDDQLEAEFGGDLDVEWNPEIYWEREREQLALYRANQEELNNPKPVKSSKKSSSTTKKIVSDSSKSTTKTTITTNGKKNVIAVVEKTDVLETEHDEIDQTATKTTKKVKKTTKTTTKKSKIVEPQEEEQVEVEIEEEPIPAPKKTKTKKASTPAKEKQQTTTTTKSWGYDNHESELINEEEEQQQQEEEPTPIPKKPKKKTTTTKSDGTSESNGTTKKVSKKKSSSTNGKEH